MKKNQVEVGKSYRAKVSGKLTTVRIESESPYGGWNAVNVDTGREVRISTAARLRATDTGSMPEKEDEMSGTSKAAKARKVASTRPMFGKGHIEIAKEIETEKKTPEVEPASPIVDGLVETFTTPAATFDAEIAEAKATTGRRTGRIGHRKAATLKAKEEGKERAIQGTDGLVTFAFRIPKAESEAIHKAAGPGKASRFARAILAAAASNDLEALRELLQSRTWGTPTETPPADLAEHPQIFYGSDRQARGFSSF